MKSSTVSSFLSKILSLLKSHFLKVFQINTFGKPREYSIGSILELMIFSARNSSFSFRKIVKLIRDDEYVLTLLKFNRTPHFSVLFKTYKKYIEPNINLYLSKIGASLNKNPNVFYLDSSSLISNKHDKNAKWGISTRHDWYKGYKLHMICSSNGIPICISISTANVHDSKCNNLLDNFSKAHSSTVVFADKGYDSSKLIDSADRLGEIKIRA